MIGSAFADAPLWAYLIIPISALGGVTGPALNAIMSNQTPKDAQGELQGAVASIQSFGMIFGPLVMTWTLQTFSAERAAVVFPGAAFILAACIVAFGLLPFAAGVRASRDYRSSDPAA